MVVHFDELSTPVALFLRAVSRLSNRRDISSIFANISLETPANLFESEFNKSSTTADNSAGAEASVGLMPAELRLSFEGEEI